MSLVIQTESIWGQRAEKCILCFTLKEIHQHMDIPMLLVKGDEASESEEE